MNSRLIEFIGDATQCSRFVILHTTGSPSFIKAPHAATALVFWPIEVCSLRTLAQLQTNLSDRPLEWIRVFAWIRMNEEHSFVSRDHGTNHSAYRTKVEALITDICQNSSEFSLDILGHPKPQETARLVKLWLDDLIIIKNTDEVAQRQRVTCGQTRFERCDA
jgi:hypothetical protein